MAEEKNINEETSTSEPDVKLVVDACSSINTTICGHIIGLDDNKATLQLKITPELIADSEGLAHVALFIRQVLMLHKLQLIKKIQV